ncbi:MAG: peptide chain release factor-like protein [Candidatus Omnitrophica bacterium]|nr:peptide chain release factor-like protein [Candidatus Omnitrophota bacterium]
MVLREKDIKIEYYKSSGPGGQHKNKRFTAVKVVHLPTGIFSLAAEQRSQAQNKKIALERLKEKIERLTRKKKARIVIAIPQKVKERILDKKRKHSQKKLLRKKVRQDEE